MPTSWYVECDKCRAAGVQIEGSWLKGRGPIRESYEEAQNDIDTHKKAYEDHEPTIHIFERTPCKVCGLPIPKGATICTECESLQQVTNRHALLRVGGVILLPLTLALLTSYYEDRSSAHDEQRTQNSELHSSLERFLQDVKNFGIESESLNRNCKIDPNQRLSPSDSIHDRQCISAYEDRIARIDDVVSTISWKTGIMPLSGRTRTLIDRWKNEYWGGEKHVSVRTVTKNLFAWLNTHSYDEALRMWKSDVNDKAKHLQGLLDKHLASASTDQEAIQHDISAEMTAPAGARGTAKALSDSAKRLIEGRNALQECQDRPDFENSVCMKNVNAVGMEFHAQANDLFCLITTDINRARIRAGLMNSEEIESMLHSYCTRRFCTFISEEKGNDRTKGTRNTLLRMDWMCDGLEFQEAEHPGSNGVVLAECTVPPQILSPGFWRSPYEERKKTDDSDKKNCKPIEH